MRHTHLSNVLFRLYYSSMRIMSAFVHIMYLYPSKLGNASENQGGFISSNLNNVKESLG